MTNYFMKVNKDLFKLKLNPTEILILAQVMEFNTNTGDCFISDKVMAEQFGVSESTITRELKKLEAEGFITRETKNIKGGKERHIKVNYNKIEEKLTTVNLTFEENSQKEAQQSKCLLTTVNLLIDNKQNDLIKDNLINKEKDNIREDLTARAVKPSIDYPVITVAQLTRDKIEYELIEGSRNLIRIKATGAVCKVV